MADKELFFLAIVPPDPLSEVLFRLKESFRDDYGSKASLNSAPHITLHMPFRWRKDRFEKLDGILKELAKTCSPFQAILNGWGFYSKGDLR